MPPREPSSAVPAHRDEPRETPVNVDVDVDVVVVGGGPGGLAAALMLGRARRSVVVVDAGEPRNACSPSMHGFLSRDGADPAEFLATAREEVRGYDVEIAEDTVEQVSPIEGDDGEATGAMLAVRTAGGRSWRARRVVLATGLRDELPAIPGVAERWGRDVLHCPYCHGFEVRDRPLGVLARTAEGAHHQGVLVRQLSDDVVVFLDGVAPEEMGAEELEHLSARDVPVVAGKVAEVRVEDDAVSAVVLADGRVFPRAAVFVAPVFHVNDAIVAVLGLERMETVMGTGLTVDKEGRTGVPGLWAVGNVADLSAQVLGAAEEGARAAIGINGELCLEDAERARAARAARAARSAGVATLGVISRAVR